MSRGLRTSISVPFTPHPGPRRLNTSFRRFKWLHKLKPITGIEPLQTNLPSTPCMGKDTMQSFKSLRPEEVALHADHSSMFCPGEATLCSNRGSARVGSRIRGWGATGNRRTSIRTSVGLSWRSAVLTLFRPMHGVIKVNSAGLRHADGRWSQVMCSKREALRPSEVGKENKSSQSINAVISPSRKPTRRFFFFLFFCFGFQYDVN